MSLDEPAVDGVEFRVAAAALDHVLRPLQLLGRVLRVRQHLGSRADRRERMRTLAARFPGSLRELEVVPESELYRYSTTLYSLTHGRGTYRHGFHGYVEAPPDVAARVAEEHKEEQGH